MLNKEKKSTLINRILFLRELLTNEKERVTILENRIKELEVELHNERKRRCP